MILFFYKHVREGSYTISHNPRDAPMYNHRVYLCQSKYVGKILCIEDDDKNHHPFLRQWNNMEIDINNQWSVNNGIIALHLKIHKDGRHQMQYMVRLKVKEVEVILGTPLYAMGICDERRRVLLHFKPLQVIQLIRFYNFKVETDQIVKENHLYPKGWSIE